MNFAFVYIYRHIFRKWVSLVDSKCRNTVILTGLTYTSSRKVFHDGCTKRGIFSQQILNKNSLSLAHCALNRSFTVFVNVFEILVFNQINLNVNLSVRWGNCNMFQTVTSFETSALECVHLPKLLLHI